MILKHLNSNILVIKFTSEDWSSGKSRDIIDYLKTFPKGSKFYNPIEKEWKINKQKAGSELVYGIYERQEKEYNKQEDDFDTDKWLNDTFDKKE